jgi:hypothetical protein
MVIPYSSSHVAVPARMPMRFVMASDPRPYGPIDRNRVNASEPWEIKYWTERFGVSEKQLRDAVFTVGTACDDVKQYLVKQ